jgi:hypothetical protein
MLRQCHAGNPAHVKRRDPLAPIDGGVAAHACGLQNCLEAGEAGRAMIGSLDSIRVVRR